MNTTTIRTAVAATLTLGVLGSGAVFAQSALASGGGGVRSHGSCSASSVWKLKAKHDDPNVIEVEAEVDSNVVGQHWAWNIADKGVVVKSGTAVTVAPSGSFTVARTIPNKAGADIIAFRAKNAASGETCVGKLSI